MKFLLLLIVRIDILISNKGSEKSSDSIVVNAYFTSVRNT